MFKASLRVLGGTRDPESISKFLEMTPDVVRRRGELLGPRGPEARVNEWRRNLAQGSEISEFEDLDTEVCSWGLDFAQKLGKLVKEGGVVVELSITQEFGGADTESKGLHLSDHLITWLAAAAARVDVDQYIYG